MAKFTLLISAAFVLVLSTAHAQNYSPGPNRSPFGGGPDVGGQSGGPLPYSSPDHTIIVRRPGGTTEIYGRNGQHDIAVPHNCPGCGIDVYYMH